MNLFHVIMNRPVPYLFLTETYDFIALESGLAEHLSRAESRKSSKNQAADHQEALKLKAILDYIGYIEPDEQTLGPPLDLLGLYLIISQHCPLRCKYCYAGFGNYGKHLKAHMDFETARRAIELLYRLNPEPEYIQFFGGEPALDQKLIVQIVEYLEKRRDRGEINALPSFSMVTSLSVDLNRSFLDVVERTNFCLIVSMDGPRDIHDYLRINAKNEGSFDRVLKGLDMLYAKGIRPSIESTYTSHHVDRLSVGELYRFLHDLVDYHTLFVKPVVLDRDHPLAIKNKRQWYDSQDEALSMLIDRFCGQDPIYSGELEYLVEIYTNELKFGMNHYYCADAPGMGQLVVHSNGDIFPCYYLLSDPSLNMSNIHSFDLAFFNAKQEQFKQYCKDQHQCKSCWAKYFCKVCFADEIKYKGGNYGEIDFSLCGFRRRSIENFLSGIIDVQLEPELYSQFNLNYQKWHTR